MEALGAGHGRHVDVWPGLLDEYVANLCPADAEPGVRVDRMAESGSNVVGAPEQIVLAVRDVEGLVVAHEIDHGRQAGAVGMSMSSLASRPDEASGGGRVRCALAVVGDDSRPGDRGEPRAATSMVNRSLTKI